MTAWIFDIDGVVTNLTAEKILLPQIPIIIQEKLKKGEPVAFMTGRSLKHTEQTVLSKINFNENESKNLFIAAEFGGVIATYINRQLSTNINSTYVVPPILKKKAESIIVKKYFNSIELENKQTLFTSKIKRGTSIEEFKNTQPQVITELKQLLEELHLNEYEIQGDSLGISVRYKQANKRESIKKLLDWLFVKHIMPDKFIVFGDSPSDFEMAEELSLLKLNYEFVFVGEKLNITPNFNLIKTIKKQDEGTLEFLQNTK